MMSPIKPVERPNLSGQTGIIVGGTSGIGLECARVLLEHGLSRLILSARNKHKGDSIVEQMKKTHPKANVDSWDLDLVSYDSIRAFVRQCTALENINFVIVSSAVVSNGFRVNPSTGHEEMLQVNYLSVALLSVLLLPILKAKRNQERPARLTLVGTGLIYSTKLPENESKSLLATLDGPAKWNSHESLGRYVLSKLLLVMFMIKLQGQIDPSDVIINIADPGTVKNTNLEREMPWIVKAVVGLAKSVFGRALNSAAWTYVDAAVVKGVESHGSYIMDWKIYP